MPSELLVKQDVVTPMTLIERASAQGASIEQMQQLFELKLRVEADEARKAYYSAFNSFKAEAVRIVKNVSVSDGPLKGKKYADLFGVVNAVTPVLSKHGLSHSWKLTKDERDWMEVTCTIQHVLGHSESVSMGSGPDTGPGRNAIQARASAKSYLERYTLLGATGLAAAGEDTDGFVSEGDLPEQDYVSIIDNIESAGTLDELKKIYMAGYKAAEKAKDKQAMCGIIEAKDRRRKELDAA